MSNILLGDLVNVTILANHSIASAAAAYNVSVNTLLLPNYILIPSTVQVNDSTAVFYSGTNSTDTYVNLHMDTLPLGSAVLVTFQAR